MLLIKRITSRTVDRIGKIMSMGDTVEFAGMGRLWICARDTFAMIYSFRTEATGKGYGSQILSEVCKAADKQGVILKLQAEPYAEQWLKLPALISFYKRHGFVPDELPCQTFRNHAINMTRQPIKNKYPCQK